MATDDANRKGSNPALDRRKVVALALGAAGAASASPSALAQSPWPSVPRATAPSGPPFEPAPRAAPPLPRPEPVPYNRPGVDPVMFWSDTALQLDALDHSVDAKDARAPGPCAASRALALAHIVIADACAAAYPCDFEGFYVRGGGAPANEFADVFVGGAAARILGHIYTTPAHTFLIGFQRQHFLKFYDPRALAAWNAGLEFGRNEQFTSRWQWERIKDAVLSSGSRGQNLRRGEHDVDPFNPDQKFYGVGWGQIPPLLSGLPVRELGPGDPPPLEERDYLHDLEEVREIGAFRPEGPTNEQVKIGLFWGYDGARLIGTPPRFYTHILQQIAERDRMSPPELARLLALCNLAMAEAGIVCWEAKYRYQVWRPVLGIHYARERPEPDWRPLGAARTNPTQFALGNDAQRLTALSMLGGGERNWFGEPVNNALPYERASFTPNFPSYPSGHASFGSACFNVLKRVRAERELTRHDPNDIRDAGLFVSDELNGISIDNFRNQARPYLPKGFSSIDQMIEDNNKSRVLLGVHWNFDCELGARSGARIAEAVYRNAYRRIR